MARHSYVGVSIVLLVGAGAAAACSSDGDSKGGSGAGGGAGSGTQADCGKDTDCPGELICLGGRCVTDPNIREVDCETNDDCASGEECTQGMCVRPGNCTSAADEEALGKTYPVAGLDGSTAEVEPRDVARTCGIDCVTQGLQTAEELRACSEACIIQTTGLSTGCAGCLVDSVECGRENCLGECLSDDREACFRCTCGENNFGVNCIEPYEVCSGLPSTTCDPFMN